MVEIDVGDELLALSGGDPFADVRARSEVHQREHPCGLHNAGGPQMQLVASLGRLIAPASILDLGCGLGYAGLVEYRCGRVAEVLGDINEPVDMIHDDAWFAARPAYLDAMVGLIRPGGLLTMVNWFLLVDAITGAPRNDWESFAGEGWAAATTQYAHELAVRSDLDITWLQNPPIAFAIRR